MPRVNMDEIVREFGSWKNESDAFKAGKIAVGKISSYFREALSFNQEVTLCGQSIWKNIEKGARSRLSGRDVLCRSGFR